MYREIKQQTRSNLLSGTVVEVVAVTLRLFGDYILLIAIIHQA